MDGNNKTMWQPRSSRIVPRLALLIAFALSNAGLASELDHREFEATLHAPFQADAGGGRMFTLAFDYPYVRQPQHVGWRLDVVNGAGQVVARWSGVEQLFKKTVSVKLRFDDEGALAAGVYQVRMMAATQEVQGQIDKSEAALDAMFRHAGDALAEQRWDIAIGAVPAPAIPAFAPLSVSDKASAGHSKESSQHGGQSKESKSVVATAALPYTIYYGNLHSQTNHSDGGGNLAACTGAQSPQSAAYSPTDAFNYAAGKGLDILVASEHNHMYDGSDSTNTVADPALAKSLFQSGLTAAANYNTTHPNFLAVYGLEWGVINNGGHMNIFNSSELLGWESNANGQLIGDTYTAKNDYASLYTLMAQRGWVGQFNHPSTSGQFIVNGSALGYSADGDTAMALCEVLNTSAFSVNTTETETGRSSYEVACNKALEAGYHVAFSTDQDNHCANWGASYTNRTGVLIPIGTPLTNASFIAALKARRVFATMDKSSQLILTANGHVMGERFSNSGPLTLTANYASNSGRSVATISIVEGVPGRNGTPTELAASASTTTTPSVGEHYYYAKLTQDDGNILWSAPLWVSQTSGSGDSTAPTVSASENGSSGSVTLSAAASDNVGVTLVEFYVDGALKGSSNSAPYSAALNSTLLSNGSHTLVAKAYDAANNVGSSSPVAFSVSNMLPDSTAPTVSASESGSSGSITMTASASDNVGVTKVEFYVDGVLKSTDTSSPYSATLNSSTLSNGSHALSAKAYDAAGNVATSSAVSFSINNAAQQLIVNGSFESGSGAWTASSGVITNDATQSAHGGTYKAWLDGYGAAHTDTIYQTVSIPSALTSATLSFWLRVDSGETTTTEAYDTLKVQLRNSSGSVLATLATYSNLNKGSSFVQKSFDLSAYQGQTVRIYFEGIEGSTVTTSFIIDDVSLSTQ